MHDGFLKSMNRLCTTVFTYRGIPFDVYQSFLTSAKNSSFPQIELCSGFCKFCIEFFTAATVAHPVQASKILPDSIEIHLVKLSLKVSFVELLLIFRKSSFRKI